MSPRVALAHEKRRRVLLAAGAALCLGLGDGRLTRAARLCATVYAVYDPNGAPTLTRSFGRSSQLRCANPILKLTLPMPAP